MKQNIFIGILNILPIWFLLFVYVLLFSFIYLINSLYCTFMFPNICEFYICNKGRKMNILVLLFIANIRMIENNIKIIIMKGL